VNHSPLRRNGGALVTYQWKGETVNTARECNAIAAAEQQEIVGDA